MKLYKLTDQNHQTRNNTKWGEGVEHTAPGGDVLCNRNWLHAYTDPLLAVLLNPIHAGIDNPVLWEAEGDVGADDGLKVGCTRLRTIRTIELPEVTTEQRVRFAILCAKKVNCNEELSQWTVNRSEELSRWADKWLSGEDRSKKAAEAAEWAAAELEEETTRAAARAAAWSAKAAEAAADGVSWAAARASARSARAAAGGSVAAAAATADIDLAAIAREACS